MQIIPYEVVYIGTNVREWKIKDYIVTYNFNKWLCSCSIKYKRNPELNCKHIDIVKAFFNKTNQEIIKND